MIGLESICLGIQSHMTLWWRYGGVMTSHDVTVWRHGVFQQNWWRTFCHNKRTSCDVTPWHHAVTSRRDVLTSLDDFWAKILAKRARRGRARQRSGVLISIKNDNRIQKEWVQGKFLEYRRDIFSYNYCFWAISTFFDRHLLFSALYRYFNSGYPDFATAIYRIWYCTTNFYYSRTLVKDHIG